MKQSICPISGKPKRRRHAVAPEVWKNASAENRRAWKENANPGSLRRFSVTKQK